MLIEVYGDDVKYRLGVIAAVVSTVALVAYLFVVRLSIVPGDYSVELTPYVASLFISVVSVAALIFMILRTRSRSATAVWFMAIAITSLLWSGSLILFAWSVSPETAQFWQHLLGIFWVPIPLFMLFFVISHVDDEGLTSHPIIWVLLPMTAVLFIYILGYNDFLYFREPTEVVKYYWGLESRLGEFSGLVFTWLALVSTLALVLLIMAYRKSTNILKKRQTMFFIFAIGQFIVGGVVFDMFYYSLTLSNPDYFKLPPLTFLYTAVMAIILGYGIIRYGVFKVNPASLSGTILENLQEAVVAVNNDLEIEFTNKGTEIITGLKEDTLKGQHVSILFDTDVFQQIRGKLGNGENYFELDDTLVKNSSGITVPVTLSIGAVFDERKRKAGSIFVFANISELKRRAIELAEEKASVETKVRDRTRELSDERARLSASINSLRLGYLMTSTTNEVVVMNSSAQKLLKTLSDLQDMPVPDMWDLGAIQKVLGGVDIAHSSGAAHGGGKHLDLKEVRVADRFLYVLMSPVTKDNEVIGSVILFEDITDERALKRSKEEFFILASHELRTPLTKIQGSAEIIRDVYKTSITSDDAMKMLQEIEVSSSHLIDIINVIIEITELEQGKVELKPEEFDLQAMSRRVVEGMQAKFGTDEVEARVDSGLPELKVVADKNKTEQIIRSFISNAFKFTKQGSIVISFEQKEGAVRVRVADTGIGIKPDNKSLLFRKFQQAGSSLLARDGEGTGLGLYVVKLIANIMGATVGLESSEEGQGSVFYLDLPSTPKEKAPLDQ